MWLVKTKGLNFIYQKALIRIFNSFYLDFKDGYRSVFSKNNDFDEKIYKLKKINTIDDVLYFKNIYSMHFKNHKIKKSKIEWYKHYIYLVNIICDAFLIFYESILSLSKNNFEDDVLKNENDLILMLNNCYDTFRSSFKKSYNLICEYNNIEGYNHNFNDYIFKNLFYNFLQFQNDDLNENYIFNYFLSFFKDRLDFEEATYYFNKDFEENDELVNKLTYESLTSLYVFLFSGIFRYIIMFHPTNNFKYIDVDVYIQNVWLFSSYDYSYEYENNRVLSLIKEDMKYSIFKKMRRDPLEKTELYRIISYVKISGDTLLINNIDINYFNFNDLIDIYFKKYKSNMNMKYKTVELYSEYNYHYNYFIDEILKDYSLNYIEIDQSTCKYINDLINSDINKKNKNLFIYDLYEYWVFKKTNLWLKEIIILNLVQLDIDIFDYNNNLNYKQFFEMLVSILKETIYQYINLSANYLDKDNELEKITCKLKQTLDLDIKSFSDIKSAYNYNFKEIDKNLIFKKLNFDIKNISNEEIILEECIMSENYNIDILNLDESFIFTLMYGYLIKIKYMLDIFEYLLDSYFNYDNLISNLK
ncbi:hypothetical protein SLITO_v1c06070 [Spiroplasma litorale]|uniref:Uncharacterized protein n=1 Tax=Spiroplasma litorale TaxID=216942 RepID=A0A0K1W233_9MOLU|nr:hypothetical protein [Spiroplasma litorale]AKX34241.1 hypothetical protein SLITO_v1c06070 [Spiroplasma litorale]